MTESGYGADGWGSGPWGDGDEAFALSSAVARRENVVRLGFTQPVFLDGLLGPSDGSVPTRYLVSAVASSVGYDGAPARPVAVVSAALAPEDDLDAGAFGYIVDLTLDRPMSPFPALYDAVVADLFSADLEEEIENESVRFNGLFRELARPRLDEPSPSIDFAHGSYLADDTGDFATDQGEPSLKKRLWRRLVTEPGAFSHLPPDYGIGIRRYAKQLARTTTRSRLVTECEVQFAREPEVAKVRCAFVRSAADPSAWILRVLVRTRGGLSQRYDMPVG